MTVKLNERWVRGKPDAKGLRNAFLLFTKKANAPNVLQGRGKKVIGEEGNREEKGGIIVNTASRVPHFTI